MSSYLDAENLPWLKEGRYDLRGPGDHIIMPSLWEQVVQAGWVIKMVPHPNTRHVFFMDAMGRKFTFPFDLCKEWHVRWNLPIPPPFPHP